MKKALSIVVAALVPLALAGGAAAEMYPIDNNPGILGYQPPVAPEAGSASLKKGKAGKKSKHGKKVKKPHRINGSGLDLDSASTGAVTASDGSVGGFSGAGGLRGFEKRGLSGR